eukprot:5505223-Prymnesium_polylepis.1
MRLGRRNGSVSSGAGICTGARWVPLAWLRVVVLRAARVGFGCAVHVHGPWWDGARHSACAWTMVGWCTACRAPSGVRREQATSPTKAQEHDYYTRRAPRLLCRWLGAAR